MADKKNAPKKNGPASTVPKKVSNKEIRKARQAAKASKERVPAGMDPKDYADAAFRKKVTIIMGSILLTFIIGLVVFLIVTKVQYDFEGQRDDIKQALAEAGDDSEESGRGNAACSRAGRRGHAVYQRCTDDYRRGGGQQPTGSGRLCYFL